MRKDAITISQCYFLIRVKRRAIQDRGWFGQAVIAEECFWIHLPGEGNAASEVCQPSGGAE